MKKSKNIVLVIAPILGTILACSSGGGSSSSTTRDVYQNKEDCQKDWGEQDLCEQMNDQDDGEYRRNGGVVTGSRPFYGPPYYTTDRSVNYRGRTISPPGRSSTLPSYNITSRSSSSSRSSSISSPRSSSSSYGGFGGRTSGGGSSSS